MSLAPKYSWESRKNETQLKGTKWVIKWAPILQNMTQHSSTHPILGGCKQRGGAQCGNLRILMPFRFYVKSILANFESQKLLF